MHNKAARNRARHEIDRIGQALIDAGHETAWVHYLNQWETDGSIPPQDVGAALEDARALASELGVDA